MNLLKKILLLLVLSLVFFVSINKDNKISYFSFGDGLSKGINSNNKIGYGYSDYIADFINNENNLKTYIKAFSDEDLRITDLITIINENKFIKLNNKKVSIQNALKNSNLITLSIGMNEILYKYNNNINDEYMYKYIDEFMNDMNNLINKIKKLQNKNIFILGFYNPYLDNSFDKFVKYANNKLINICNKNKINYVNLYEIFNNNKHMIYNINNHYPNEDGYKLIANEIISIYKKNKSLNDTIITSKFFF